MFHDAEMDGAGHVAGPPIKIDEGPDVERVPTRADECGGAIAIIAELELPTMEADMPIRFGVGGLFGDVEREPLPGHKLGDRFLDHDAVAEDTAPIRADEIASVGGAHGIGQTELENPVVRSFGDFRKGKHMWPHFGRRRLDEDFIDNHRLLVGPGGYFATAQ